MLHDAFKVGPLVSGCGVWRHAPYITGWPNRRTCFGQECDLPMIGNWTLVPCSRAGSGHDVRAAIDFDRSADGRRLRAGH